MLLILNFLQPTHPTLEEKKWKNFCHPRKKKLVTKTVLSDRDNHFKWASRVLKKSIFVQNILVEILCQSGVDRDTVTILFSMTKI